jgi:hypothetical protein
MEDTPAQISLLLAPPTKTDVLLFDVVLLLPPPKNAKLLLEKFDECIVLQHPPPMKPSVVDPENLL